MYHNLWKSDIWKSNTSEKSNFRLGHVVQDHAVSLLSETCVKWLSRSLVGVWTIHLKHSEIYVCQNMDHFPPKFGSNNFPTNIFETTTYTTSVFLNPPTKRIYFFSKKQHGVHQRHHAVGWLVTNAVASNCLWKQEASGVPKGPRRRPTSYIGFMCAMVKSRYIGDGHPTFYRESL